MGLILAFFLIVTIIGVSSLPASAADNRTIKVTIRDFKADRILFEGAAGAKKGLVRTTIGDDRKPVFSDPLNPSQPLEPWQYWAGASPVTLKDLNAFFNDVPGKNATTTKYLTMIKDEKGYYSVDTKDEKLFDNDMFFPIDGELFGNEDNQHNFHFSMELHAKFNYKGTESFKFSGDDDVWVFINGQLVIDLGGVHAAMTSEISLPELVAQGKLNIKPGQSFDFDMFYMERHLSQSNLNISTDIDLSNSAYGEASSWAVSELDKAAEYGLITDKIRDNMKAPITREEFSEVAVKLYEKYTGTEAVYTPPAPFVDTSNVDIYKANQLGIVFGTDTAKKLFTPYQSITREQIAALLYRAVKKMSPNADLSTAGAENFKDIDLIYPNFLESVKFLNKNEIMKANNGFIGPKDTASREQAVLMAVRIYEAFR